MSMNINSLCNKHYRISTNNLQLLTVTDEHFCLTFDKYKAIDVKFKTYETNVYSQ